MDTTVDEILNAYKKIINSSHPQHHKKLIGREKNNLDGVKLEAIMFFIARHYNLSPTINEDISKGGADFECRSQRGSFILEVTHLDTSSISNHSGLNNNPIPLQTYGFSLITKGLQKKVISKTEQLAKYPMPRVLCIGATHKASQLLLGTYAAENLLTSNTKISFRIDESVSRSKIVADLNESVFFKFDSNGKIEPCRQSVSAILLVSFNDSSCGMTGILHPQPIYSFDMDFLPDIPFLRVVNWPCENRKIITDWSQVGEGFKPSPTIQNKVKSKRIDFEDIISRAILGE